MKKDMTAGKEWKHILLFTLPIMAGSLLQQLYNTVDGIVVGHYVGEDAFAGVGTCTPLTFLFLAFAIGLSVGASVTIAQLFGARRHEDMHAAIDTSLILIGAFGLVFTVAGFVLTPLLLRDVLGVPENILPYAITYFRIYSLGLFFQFVYNAIAFVLRGVGDSRAMLYFLLVATVLNAVLDIVFIAVLHWGVAGAAIATVISQAACVVVSYVYLRKRFPFVRGGVHFDWKQCRFVLRLGIPSAIQQTIVSIGSGAMQRLVNGFGGANIPAFAAANRITNFMFVPIMGLQSGISNFTGQNIGAGQLDRVRRGYRATMVMGLIATLIVCGALYIFASPIVALFSLEGESLAIGIEQIRFYSVVFVTFSVYMVTGGVLQGAGDVLFQSVATLTALILRIVLSYAGVHFGIFGYNAVWVTNPMGWGAALIITMARYYSGRWKTKAIASRSDNPSDGDKPAFVIAE